MRKVKTPAPPTGLFPAEKTKAKGKGRSPRTVGIEDLLAKEFDLMPLDESIPFERFCLDLMGQPVQGAWIQLYADAKSGKSYFATEMVHHFSRFLGKGLYCSAEEGLEYSVQRRFKQLGITRNDNIRLYGGTDKEAIVSYLLKSDWKWVVVDSPQHINLTPAEATDLHADVRRMGKMVILVQQVTVSGDAKGGTDWGHLVDVRLNIRPPYIYCLSRYGGTRRLMLPYHAALLEAETAKAEAEKALAQQQAPVREALGLFSTTPPNTDAQ